MEIVGFEKRPGFSVPGVGAKENGSEAVIEHVCNIVIHARKKTGAEGSYSYVELWVSGISGYALYWISISGYAV
jgi:hypothetical protein